MMRKLLVTTAIVTIAVSGAHAAQHSNEMQAQPSDRFLTKAENASLASRIIGETVYVSAAQDAESVGEVNDLVVGDDGDIDAAIIGVGGFLGIGEKDVAVSYDDLRLATAENGELHVVLETSKQELETAPDFDTEAVSRPARRDKTAAQEPKADDGKMAANDQERVEISEQDRMAAAGPAMQDNNTAAQDRMTAADPLTPSDRVAVAPQRERFKPVEADKVGTDEFIGAYVYSYTNDNLGDIGEVVLTDDGRIDAVIIDVGGFLGIGEKPVAVAFSDLEVLTDESGSLYVYTRFTEEQLEAAREYDEDEFKQNRDRVLMRSSG